MLRGSSVASAVFILLIQITDCLCGSVRNISGLWPQFQTQPQEPKEFPEGSCLCYANEAAPAGPPGGFRMGAGRQKDQASDSTTELWTSPTTGPLIPPTELTTVPRLAALSWGSPCPQGRFGNAYKQFWLSHFGGNAYDIQWVQAKHAACPNMTAPHTIKNLPVPHVNNVEKTCSCQCNS